MPDINRRRFLQLAGATAAYSALSNSIAKAAAIPAHSLTGSINDIEHIVVLMQENRSFDHYFGSLSGVRGFGDPRPVTLPSGKSVWHQSDGTKDVLPFHPTADNLGMQFIQDLPHGWNDGHQAFNGGKYDQWIKAKGTTTMAYLTRNDIPFHYALADAFTICDAYHCSFIGATDPNRYYLWTGYTGNDGTGGGPVLGNDEAGYSWTTYPERLEQAGVSWKIYQDTGIGLNAAGSWGWTNDAYIGNYGDNSLLYFNQYRNAQPGTPLYEKARTGTTAKDGDDFFRILKADVANGTLPQISWIAAPEAFTEHPNWPANYGAWYLSQVLDALTSNPAVWSKTALFITYDENDGFFDHVVPAYPPSSSGQGASTVSVDLDLYNGGGGKVAGPYGLGQRVPMIVVSPWSKGGYVCSETFDHTSVIRFMERRFGVHEPNISPWRRTVVGDLTSAFDFAQADSTVGALPNTDAYQPTDHNRHPDYVPAPPANPVLPPQERGQRPTRALPYTASVDAATSASSSKLTLTFGTGSGAGAAFYVTSGNRTDGPWSYTVETGKTLAGSWTTSSTHGLYDLTVHGPNGLLRAFKGKAKTAGPEVTARPSGDNLQLTLSNAGKTAVTLTLTNAYGGASQTITVQAGGTSSYTVDLTASQRWYDVTVTAANGFLRRFAGHLENGRPGVSDPAVITA
ncbi:MAG TPA: phospholipase C, phosphocholine-specific [Kribbellaceae bacterium]